MSAPIFEPGELTESGYWQVVVTPASAATWVPPVPQNLPGAPGPRGTPAHAMHADTNTGQFYGSSAAVDVTVFRGAPTQINSLGTTDPFGPSVATLGFPAITILEQIGAGDLSWCQPESNVDICWMHPDGYPITRWEGYFHSFDWSEDETNSSLTITCTGAMRQLDNYLAKPEYRYYPRPYEWAIHEHFNLTKRPDLRLAPMAAPASSFPAWWTTTFNAGSAAYPKDKPWLMPHDDVAHGEKWSGMLTRETGHFEPVLTSYIQGLLANMYTPKGQFTLRLDNGRLPVLAHRDHLTEPAVGDTLVVDLLWRGVTMHPTSDYSQKIGVIYGQGRSLSGDAFSGQEVTADGTETYYDPMSYDPQVHPAQFNPKLNKAIMRKEINLQFPDGLTDLEARRAADHQRANFADPGIVGQIILKIDPILYGVGTSVPRATITAGRSILVKGLFGNQDGILFHITETSIDFELTLTLTVDSKFRDYLTVDQVRLRARDSLQPFRMLSITATFDPKVPDLLYPWSYAKGAGVIPKGGGTLFSKWGPSAVKAAGVGDPQAIPFPWEEYTTRFPPQRLIGGKWKDANKGFYIRIPPKDANADYNWANANYKPGRRFHDNKKPEYTFEPYPVLFAAAGSIRMIQIAAYDRTGHVMPVTFHVSVYQAARPQMTAMPMMPKYPLKLVMKNAVLTIRLGSKDVTLSKLPVGHGITKGMTITVACGAIRGVSGNWKVTSVTKNTAHYSLSAKATGNSHAAASVSRPSWQPYPATQHYPFFPEAFQTITGAGTVPLDAQQIGIAAGNPPIYGVGTGWERGGYWPGSQASDPKAKTGLHVDETPFPFDFKNKNHVDQRKSPKDNQSNPNNVTGYVMIYCDDQGANDVYFLGRLFRQEPTGG
jgi:hypothetical protein